MRNLRKTSSCILYLFSTAPVMWCFLSDVQQYFVHDILFAEVLQMNIFVKQNTFQVCANNPLFECHGMTKQPYHVAVQVRWHNTQLAHVACWSSHFHMIRAKISGMPAHVCKNYNTGLIINMRTSGIHLVILTLKMGCMRWPELLVTNQPLLYKNT